MSVNFTPWLIYSTTCFAVGIGARAWAIYSANVRKRREESLPIVDPFALEVAFAPRTTSPDDDEAILDAMKETVARVNRKSQSLEFETVDRDLVSYYGGLPASARPTARHAVERLQESPEPKLREVGAKVAPVIGVGTAAGQADAAI